MPSSFLDNALGSDKEGCSLHANLSKLDMPILSLLNAGVRTSTNGAASCQGRGKRNPHFPREEFWMLCPAPLGYGHKDEYEVGSSGTPRMADTEAKFGITRRGQP